MIDDVDHAIGLSRAIAQMIVNDKMPRRGRHVSAADIRLVIRQVKEAVRLSTDETIDLTMDAVHAQLFIDFLYDWDPDMPPRPICKILGPLVGDIMMNDKLNRLDEIADKLGPMMIVLSGLIAPPRSR
jgi:hypothetical protein